MGQNPRDPSAECVPIRHKSQRGSEASKQDGIHGEEGFGSSWDATPLCSTLPNLPHHRKPQRHRQGADCVVASPRYHDSVRGDAGAAGVAQRNSAQPALGLPIPDPPPIELTGIAIEPGAWRASHSLRDPRRPRISIHNARRQPSATFGGGISGWRSGRRSLHVVLRGDRRRGCGGGYRG
jgi:hypothetical protein